MADDCQITDPAHDGDAVSTNFSVSGTITVDPATTDTVADLAVFVNIVYGDASIPGANQTVYPDSDPTADPTDPTGTKHGKWTTPTPFQNMHSGAATIQANTFIDPTPTATSPIATRAINIGSPGAGSGGSSGSHGRGFGGGTLTISSPLAGSNVSGPFTATGTIQNAVSENVSGNLTLSSNVFNGTTVANGPNWQINFPQPVGSLAGAVLKVWCSDDNTVFAQESLGRPVLLD